MSTLYNELSADEKKRLKDWNDDVVITGRIDYELTTCACELGKERTQVVAFRNNPGFTDDSKVVWPENPASNDNLSQIKVEVWTGKSNYSIGEPINIYLKANRNCYITIADIQTSGKVKLFFPLFERNRNMMLIGKEYKVPIDGEPLMKVDGPAGVEKIKAIVSIKPLFLDDVVKDNLPEQFFVDILSLQLKRLQSNRSWAISGCSFNVNE